jgi:hypothetical protein
MAWYCRINGVEGGVDAGVEADSAVIFRPLPPHSYPRSEFYKRKPISISITGIAPAPSRPVGGMVKVSWIQPGNLFWPRERRSSARGAPLPTDERLFQPRDALFVIVHFVFNPNQTPENLVASLNDLLEPSLDLLEPPIDLLEPSVDFVEPMVNRFLQIGKSMILIEDRENHAEKAHHERDKDWQIVHSSCFIVTLAP